MSVIRVAGKEPHSFGWWLWQSEVCAAGCAPGCLLKHSILNKDCRTEFPAGRAVLHHAAAQSGGAEHKCPRLRSEKAPESACGPQTQYFSTRTLAASSSLSSCCAVRESRRKPWPK